MLNLVIRCGHCSKTISEQPVTPENKNAKIATFRGVRLKCPHCQAQMGPKLDVVDAAPRTIDAPPPPPPPAEPEPLTPLPNGAPPAGDVEIPPAL